MRVLADRYVLFEVRGTGGMATVWRARDEVLGRDVAVRQILDETGMLPAGEAVGIAAAVCEALEVAHTAGLVHRDIKPANIVLAAGGEVKVVDFGIARADGGGGGTRTQAVLGTAAYVSPEQASGQPAGPQADLYSLGCVLFEMLTGAPPFSADTAVGLAYRQVHDDPGPPSARRPGLPERLDQITARLLAKDPATRPPSAAAARAGLLAALNPGATAVLTPAVGEPARGVSGRRGRWRQRPAEAVLAVALAASLAALAVVLLTGTPGRAAAAPSPTHPAATHPPATRKTHQPGKHPAAEQASTLPPAAAAHAAFVGDLQAEVADGQVTPQAGQDLFRHLQQLLFGRPGQNPQQIQQQYQQLVQAYDQQQSQGQITGPAAARLRHALAVLGAALGAL